MAQTIVEAIDVQKNFDAVEVLRGVSFALAKGETLVVMGGSGSGKTVLLRLGAGLIPPGAGRGPLFDPALRHPSVEGGPPPAPAGGGRDPPPGAGKGHRCNPR